MSLYEQDFYRWTQEQAELLKAGLLNRLDVENLVEEIEDMGKSQKRELMNRLTILLLHMLKCDHQPEKHTRSWDLSIKEQRLRLEDHITDNPSLTHIMAETITKAYKFARIRAAAETGIEESAFPETCPYDAGLIMGE